MNKNYLKGNVVPGVSCFIAKETACSEGRGGAEILLNRAGILLLIKSLLPLDR